MRASGIYGVFSGIKLPMLCKLSWLHFDGVEVEGLAAEPVNQTFMGLCGQAGMLLVLAPREITQYFIDWNPPTSYWFRWTDSVSGMFEGAINYVSSGMPFHADISLAIPDNSDFYIDTDKYHMLSFGIVGSNLNNTGGAFAMHIRWRDSRGTWHGWENLLGSDYSVGNGWDEYSVIGPIDLNGIDNLDWGIAGDASELWLSLRSGCPITPGTPIDVRIGWIKLEESAQ